MTSQGMFWALIECFSDADKEEIEHLDTNKGPTAAMCLLLTLVSRRKEEWFAALMWSLLSNNHKNTVRDVDERLLSARKSVASVIVRLPVDLLESNEFKVSFYFRFKRQFDFCLIENFKDMIKLCEKWKQDIKAQDTGSILYI